MKPISPYLRTTPLPKQTMLTTEEDKYALGRGASEIQRLNTQHNCLKKVSENALIHPSIPMDKELLAIADLGTGTGIWLKDVNRMLEDDGIASYCHGFDVSDEQFPKYRGYVEYSVQDTTEPFPAEHWNKYDIVHVRLLIAAINECDYEKVVKNALQILKPGGFLQWEETDEETYLTKDNPVIEEMRRCFDTALKAEGKAFQTTAKVAEECKAAGFQDVQRVFYRSDTNPDISQTTDQWFAAVIDSVYGSLIFRSGEAPSEEAARKQAGELIEQHYSLCAKGMSPPLTLSMVVAQKSPDAPLQ